MDDVAISQCSACQSVVIASVSAAIPQHRSPLSFGVAAALRGSQHPLLWGDGTRGEKVSR